MLEKVPKDRVVRYPSRLREIREGRLLTRTQLEDLTSRLEEQDPKLFRRVGFEAIKAIEAGWTRPRTTTARSLCEALGATAAELFPSGVDFGPRPGAGRKTA